MAIETEIKIDLVAPRRSDNTPTHTICMWIMETNGNELDLNIMRYIHGKDWEPNINDAIPDIQIGGKAGHSSIEHLVLINTWMLNIEVNQGHGYSKVLIWRNSLIRKAS